MVKLVLVLLQLVYSFSQGLRGFLQLCFGCFLCLRRAVSVGSGFSLQLVFEPLRCPRLPFLMLNQLMSLFQEDHKAAGPMRQSPTLGGDKIAQVTSPLGATQKEIRNLRIRFYSLHCLEHSEKIGKQFSTPAMCCALVPLMAYFACIPQSVQGQPDKTSKPLSDSKCVPGHQLRTTTQSLLELNAQCTPPFEMHLVHFSDLFHLLLVVVELPSQPCPFSLLSSHAFLTF